MSIANTVHMFLHLIKGKILVDEKRMGFIEQLKFFSLETFLNAF